MGNLLWSWRETLHIDEQVTGLLLRAKEEKYYGQGAAAGEELRQYFYSRSEAPRSFHLQLTGLEKNLEMMLCEAADVLLGI